MAEKRPRVLFLNGPNLNLLGEREESLYGTLSLTEVNEILAREAEALGLEVEFFQSNYEGELIEKVHSARRRFEVLVVNAGALTHYSWALHDALRASGIPVIEVHLTNIYAREPWRATSVIAPVARGQITGFGWFGYVLALHAAAHLCRGSVPPR